MTLAISGTTGITLAGQFDSASTFGFKNRLINGQMQIAQRGTSGTSGSTVPTTAPTYPSIDRWYAYATGATVTVAQAAGSGATKNTLQVTGAASVTAVGVGQRIEQLNSYDLAGSTCTLSVNMSNSLLTTVTWTASYAASADTWSSKTQIATGTFTVSSTLANYSAQVTVPAAATTGIEILFTVGAQTSGTWVIGNAQFEKSSTATSFDFRSYGTELALCQRYLPVWSNKGSLSNGAVGVGQLYSTTQAVVVLPYTVTPRTQPTGIGITGGTSYVYNTGATLLTTSSLAFNSASLSGIQVVPTFSASGTAAGNATNLLFDGLVTVYATGCEL